MKRPQRISERIAALPSWGPARIDVDYIAALKARLELAVAHIEQLAYGGFDGQGVIPRHYRNTWEATVAVIAACKEPTSCTSEP